MSSQVASSYCVVGDRFAGFAVHDRVRTLSAFLGELRAGAYDDVPGPMALSGGQGIGGYEWDHIRVVLRRRGLEDRILLQEHPPALARRAEAHKHREENVLIADLGRHDDQIFHAALRLHQNNEFLLDHQTGQHTQGMVVVEAARQMFLAVTERYYTHRWPERHYYFVINSLATTFENFLFPVDARIRYLIQSADLSDPGRLEFTARVDIEQGGRRSARCEVAFTAFDATVLKAVEHRRAERALDHVLAHTSARHDEHATAFSG
ncbi:AfsA-related hotdog domain-containing protein [Nocardiopsis halotolerans]|uniref:AfsA-related hotdog domain-containing protein n=1 Tax=Nocardiopsis halotolerans TaxID=124252 RepID=UPI001360B493|nr:AfsA-related hotdog domain-containing protein [Nocardiopsis halotolerans]